MRNKFQKCNISNVIFINIYLPKQVNKARFNGLQCLPADRKKPEDKVFADS